MFGNHRKPPSTANRELRTPPSQRMDQLIEFVRNLLQLRLRRWIAHRQPQRVHPIAVAARAGTGAGELRVRHLVGRSIVALWAGHTVIARRSLIAVAAAMALGDLEGKAQGDVDDDNMRLRLLPGRQSVDGNALGLCDAGDVVDEVFEAIELRAHLRPGVRRVRGGESGIEPGVGGGSGRESVFKVRCSQSPPRSSGRESASGFVLVLLLELVLDQNA